MRCLWPVLASAYQLSVPSYQLSLVSSRLSIVNSQFSVLSFVSSQSLVLGSQLVIPTPFSSVAFDPLYTGLLESKT